MKNNDEKHLFYFDSISTFKILNKEINDSIGSYFSDNPVVITTCPMINEEIKINENYLAHLNKVSEEIKGNVLANIPDELKEIVWFRNPEKRIAELTVQQIEIIKRIEQTYVGKTFLSMGLRPFYFTFEDFLLFGTAIFTYLGSGIFSIHLRINIDKTYLTYEDAVLLSFSGFGSFTGHICNYVDLTEKGIPALFKEYKMIIMSSLESEKCLYSYPIKTYSILTAVDFCPSNEDKNTIENDIFYYLHQPMQRETKVYPKPEYVKSVIQHSDVSHTSNIKIYATEKRMLTCLGLLVNEIRKEDLDDDSFDKVIYEVQMQSIVPLKIVLGNYCILEFLRYVAKENVDYCIKELEELKAMIKVSINFYNFNEDFNYGTLSELMDKLKVVLKFDILIKSLNNFIIGIEEILQNKQKEKEGKSQKILAGYLGILSLILGLQATENWSKYINVLGSKIGFEFAITHPLRTALIFWMLLFSLTLIIYIVFSHNEEVKLKVNSSFMLSTDDMLKKLSPKIHVIDKKNAKR